MIFSKAYIPYGCYYSTPFFRWNGSLKHENPVLLGTNTARRWFVEKQIDPAVTDFLYFGMTNPQPRGFSGHVYASAVIQDRKKEVPAITLNQVCLTSSTAMSMAAKDVELGDFNAAFVLGTDRMSSTPMIICPDPATGAFETENVVLDNFKKDPSPGAGIPMYMTAEAVAKEYGITREECNEITAMRYEQYKDALKNDRAFQKRYMFPIESKLKKKVTIYDQDEGIIDTTVETLNTLPTIEADGVLSYGNQTHPADGNAGVIIANEEVAKAISKDPSIKVQIMYYSVLRGPAGRMAGAPALAMKKALSDTGLKASDFKHIKTHNPFIVNDIAITRAIGAKHEQMNNYGSSLVYGHPQAPTAARAIIELIEALVIDGGGIGAFTGCGAGDLGGAMIIKVE